MADLIRLGFPSRECQSRQRWQGFRPAFAHDRGPVVFDCALADAKIGSNILAGMTGEDQNHDLPLPRRQSVKMVQGFGAVGGATRRFSPVLQGAQDTCNQFSAADRLFDEIDSSGLHGIYSQPDITAVGYHDDRHGILGGPKLQQKREATKITQRRIGQQAGVVLALIDPQKRSAIGKCLGAKAICLKQPPKCRANMGIVIDDKDKGAAVGVASAADPDC